METRLGKISKVHFGIAGYNESQIGLFLEISGEGWGVATGSGFWDPESIKVTEYTKWTEKERDERLSNIMREVSKLLRQAKVNDVAKLKGIPVECKLENGSLKSWRILTEVL